MCYLPKATFYVYFLFFLLGYIWVFGVLFYNTWENGKKRAGSLPSQQEKNNYKPAERSSDLDSVWQAVPIFNLSGAPLAGNAYCVQLITDPKFKLCLHDPSVDKGVSAYINVYKEWEPELSKELKSVLNKHPGALFLDVGANIGYYALLAAKLGHSVIAIEPFPDNRELFKLSAHLNSLPTNRITVIPAAVSDKRGNVSFAEDPGNVGGRFIISSEEQNVLFRSRKRIHVRSVLLDDTLTLLTSAVDSIAKVNSSQLKKLTGNSKVEIIMKIDIQGHECYAIRGGRQLLKRAMVSVIFMEWEESRKLDSDHGCLMDMLGILQENGYRCFGLDGRLITRLHPKDLSLPKDIVWRKFVRNS